MTWQRRCDHDEVIALNAAGLTQKEIGIRIGIAQSSVSKLLRRHDVKAFREPGPPRRYKLNDEYFTTIDTPEKAYWLGFLAADGGITQRYTNGDRRGMGLFVRVGAVDIGHLQQLADALESDVKPKIRNDGAADVRFNSPRLAAGLMAHGATPRKTWTCSPWDAPADLAPHYWRGLVDGDGTVMADGKTIVFVGTLAMVEGFRSFAARICGTRAAPRQYPGCWRVTLQGRRQVHAMLSVLYAEDRVSLIRKKEAALAITAEPYTPLRFKKSCRICGDTAIARLLCGKHYQRWKLNGDPSVSLINRDPDLPITVLKKSDRMRCNLCGFLLPSPDSVSIALMHEHLYREHDIERFRPQVPLPIGDTEAC